MSDRGRGRKAGRLYLAMTSDKVPAELLQTVVEYFKPRRIILFGSRARADARETSDHDLLVVVDE